MKRINKVGSYKCPHKKGDLIVHESGQKYYRVDARYCKNNCKLYRLNCKRWGK